ncbi:YihY/virulence factor BrkB family protein [Nonlabens mediterrranea]|uniref:YihY/virulence factor BrkB family protein n=1 Tax=Nonlabens mediterrranea TaxID=1419947 RepID=A0ABS0A580_9FLAO|nr:ribonuclease BN family [Flavobacteria bacterium BBFL7]MBF4984281.1 YihY/virulence factor BrkB family protein [Nonlabens mediterrranea]
MSKTKDLLDRIPVLRWPVNIANKIRIPGLEGMTLYDVAETYIIGIAQGAFSARASAISYSFFMAIFPFLLFVLNLIPFIPIENFQNEFLEFVIELLPAQAVSIFDQIFKEIALQGNTGLLTIAFVSSLIFMSNGVNAVFNGFERSFHTDFNRGFFRQYAISLAVSVLLTIFLLIMVIVTGYVEYLLEELRKSNIMSETGQGETLVFVRYLIVIILTYIFVAVLYYFGTRDGRQTRFFSIGASVTTVLIVLLSVLYGVYIDNFTSYNEIYGSIGALLILMIYIWLNSNILLLGFELNASLRKLKAQNLNS